MSKKFSCLLVLALFCKFIFAGLPNRVVLDQNFYQKTEGFLMYHYHDKSDKLDAQDIAKLKLDSLKTYPNNHCNLGYRNVSNWLIINILNQKENHNFHLTNLLYFSQEAQVYVFKDGKEISRSFLHGIRKKSNYLHGNRFYVPIKMVEKGEYQIIFNIRNKYSSLRPMLNLESEKSFADYKEFRENEENFFIFVAGIISMILIASLITYIIKKEKIFLLYFLFTGVNLMSIFINSGLLASLHQWFYWLKFDPRTYSGFWLMLIAVPFVYEFNKAYLNYRWIKILNRVFMGYLVFTLVVSQFMSYTSLLFLVNSYLVIFIYLGCFLIFVIYPIISVRKGYFPAKLFLLAYLGFFVNVIYNLLYIQKIIPPLHFNYLTEVAVIFELIVMAFALSFRISQVSKDNYLLAKKLSIEQENIIKQSIDVQNKEMANLSKELHDNIGQQLTGLKFLIYGLGKSQPDSKLFTKYSSVLENAIENVRSLSHQMMPSHLVKAGLNASLEALCKSKSSENLPVFYDSFNVPDIDNEQFILNIYRIAQETLENAIKHSKATKIDVNLMFLNGNLILNIKDNGLGFDANEQNFKYGLRLASNRANVLNAKFSIESDADFGTELSLKIPFEFDE